MSFPINPTDGQGYINSLGTRYVYNAADNKWVIQSQDIGVTGPIGPPGSGFTGLINIDFDQAYGYLYTGLNANVMLPFKCTIYNWYVLGGSTGYCEYKVSKCTSSNYPNGETMYQNPMPNLTKQIYNTGSLSGWTGAYGDILRVSFNSCTGMHASTLVLAYYRS